MRILAKSDIGKAREMNQDSYYASDLEKDELKLYILADGMGGYKGGEIASNLATTSARNYIEENFNNKNLSLSSVADHLNTSVYVVTRLFKETTGKNFKEYVMDKRMEYAGMLLKTTSHKVTEISGMAGFENAEYFSSLFKMKYGMTPTQYRKN